MLVGVAKIHEEGDIKLSDEQVTSSTGALLALAGVGVSYQMNSKIAFGLEYSRTRSKDAEGDHIGIPATNLTTLNMNYYCG